MNKCKAWNGPVTSVAELQRALQIAENEEECVNWELIFFRLVHPVEFKQNRQLYKVRGISHQEKLDNFMSILSDEEEVQARKSTIGKLPTNADLLKSIKENHPDENQQPDQQENGENQQVDDPLRYKVEDIKLHNLWVSMWIGHKKNVWYIGYITDTCDEILDRDVVVIDHLHSLDATQQKWKYPRKKDEVTVDVSQLLDLKPQIEWDFSGRDPMLRLLNFNDIDAEVKQRNLQPQNN